MEYSSLYELIKYIEYGTRLHIGVVFLGDNLNAKCALPHSHTIHSNEICEKFKKDPEDFARCFRCRNYAIRKAIRNRKAFGALCINGVYEYTRPVIWNGEVISIIFIGNILTRDGREKLLKRLSEDEIPEETMQTDFDLSKCEEIGRLVEGHIHTLFNNYPNDGGKQNPLIENIKSYVISNIEYDLTLSDIAPIFFYNEVYLGRLFKEETGKSFKEYVNCERVKIAKGLLEQDLSVIDAAHKAGYNNVTYFNKVFKRMTGLTPSEYKSKARG